MYFVELNNLNFIEHWGLFMISHTNLSVLLYSKFGQNDSRILHLVVLGMILLIDSRINGVILMLKQDTYIVCFGVLENSSILVTNPGEDKRMSFLLS